MVWAFDRQDRMRRNYAQLLAWSCIAGVIWIAGACVHRDLRLVLWLVALAVDVGAPVHGFRLPGVGRDADGGLDAGRRPSRRALPARADDRARRVGAAGRADVLRTAWLAERRRRRSSSASCCVRVCGRSYFLRYAERGARGDRRRTRRIAARVGRAGYAYAHAMMVAGVIVVAVAIRLTIDNPDAVPRRPPRR